MSTQRLLFFDINTQHDFLHPDGALFVPQSVGLSGRFSALTRHAVEFSFPIIASVTQSTGDLRLTSRTGGHFKIRQTQVPKALELGLSLATLRNLSSYPAIYMPTTTGNLFDNPNACPVIEALAPTGCVVYGVTTEESVREAVLGLCQMGLDVCVVTDAVAARTEAAGKAAIEEMRRAGARLSDTSRLVGFLP